MVFRKKKKKEEEFQEEDIIEEDVDEEEDEEVEDVDDMEDKPIEENTVYNPKRMQGQTFKKIIKQEVPEIERNPSPSIFSKKQVSSNPKCKIVEGILLDGDLIKYTVISNKPIGQIGEEFDI
jgi:hypothetical protein